jgi:hypothetical protein
MDKFETQRRIFAINAGLLLLSVIGLIIAIPSVLKDIYPGSAPIQAAIVTTVGVLIHLLIFFVFLRGIRRVKDHHPVNKGVNTTAAIGLSLLGLILTDGAIDSLNHALLTSIGFFTCVFCDLAAAVVSVAALFILKSKKKKEPA